MTSTDEAFRKDLIHYRRIYMTAPERARIHPTYIEKLQEESSPFANIRVVWTEGIDVYDVRVIADASVKVWVIEGKSGAFTRESWI